MTEEKKQSLHEISKALCEVYNLLLERREVGFPLTDENIEKLDSAVKTVYSNYFGLERFPTHQEKAAAFFCLIIKDHVFTDCNKRTATLWLQVYSDVNNLSIQDTVPLDVLAVSVEKAGNLEIYNLVQLVTRILFHS